MKSATSTPSRISALHLSSRAGRAMPFRPQRPHSIAATWARRVGRFALLLALMALILHRVGMLDLPHAVAAVLLAAVVAAYVLGLAVIGFFMLWQIGAKGGHASFSGMVMALMVLIPVGLAAGRYVQLPRIHDVSTDVIDAPDWLEPPPIETSWLGRSDGTAPAARELQAAAYPHITGRRYEGAIDRVLLAVRAVVEANKWTPVANVGLDVLVNGLEPSPASPETAKPPEFSSGEADPERVPLPAPRPDIENQPLEPLPTFAVLQYRTRTLVLGVPQDILIRLSEEEETTFVDMRAATRDGDHDLGLNAALITDFLRDLDIRLLGIAGG
ncbi:DUF1499 domain-containing protein [Hoeflea sp. YIM 152468]|uniref:DUF1499 domain-containing protein n=1 Tax=Hoeflea sp. YIM 152468 TaxID=3031759 RepID=UPI0023DB46BA|nr:DUF1499 domain-containing protein [Hoeflea sp. YIM 152468]MDF1608540.1 DUF1499 domain-containing protein [Hoeflea sp. YIM 152468]